MALTNLILDVLLWSRNVFLQALLSRIPSSISPENLDKDWAIYYLNGSITPKECSPYKRDPTSVTGSPYFMGLLHRSNVMLYANGKLFNIQNLRPTADLLNQNLHINKILRWFVLTLKFKKHWYKLPSYFSTCAVIFINTYPYLLTYTTPPIIFWLFLSQSMLKTAQHYKYYQLHSSFWIDSTKRKDQQKIREQEKDIKVYSHIFFSIPFFWTVVFTVTVSLDNPYLLSRSCSSELGSGNMSFPPWIFASWVIMCLILASAWALSQPLLIPLPLPNLWK